MTDGTAGPAGRVVPAISRHHRGSVPFFFAAGESIHTENSYKYSLPALNDLAEASAFAVDTVAVCKTAGAQCKSSWGAGGARLGRRMVTPGAHPSCHVVDVARPSCQPKRFLALMISATAAGTICSQAASPPWIRARTSGVRIDR